MALCVSARSRSRLVRCWATVRDAAMGRWPSFQDGERATYRARRAIHPSADEVRAVSHRSPRQDGGCRVAVSGVVRRTSEVIAMSAGSEAVEGTPAGVGGPALAGKVPIVTGSTSGIGAAIARHFAAHGAGIVLNSVRS